MKSKIVFGLSGGIRRRYGELMDPSRFVHPRVTRLGHPVSWYVDGHVEARPTFGLYSLAVLAEFLLWRAKTRRRKGGRKHDATREAVEFFAATRRALDGAIHGCRAGRELPPSKLRWLRTTVRSLCRRGKEVVEAQEAPAREDEHLRLLREWKESFEDQVYGGTGATRCRMM